MLGCIFSAAERSYIARHLAELLDRITHRESFIDHGRQTGAVVNEVVQKLLVSSTWVAKHTHGSDECYAMPRVNKYNSRCRGIATAFLLVGLGAFESLHEGDLGISVHSLETGHSAADASSSGLFFGPAQYISLDHNQAISSPKTLYLRCSRLATAFLARRVRASGRAGWR